MPDYEYTVIPAPGRAEKTRGAKSGAERFAATLTDALNGMAQQGWEYVRAEVLPSEERSGLTSRSTVYHNLLVFRRALQSHQTFRDTPQPADEPKPAPAPTPAPVLAPAPAAEPPARSPDLRADPRTEPASDALTDPAEPVRAPFSQPMRAMPKQQPQARVGEPPLTAPQAPQPTGPRLGPANR